MDNNDVTMGAIISFLGKEMTSAPPEKAELCRTAITILSALWNEGANTPEEALDILHDYQLQAKQYAALQKKHRRQALPEGRCVALPGLQWAVQTQQFLLSPLREKA